MADDNSTSGFGGFNNPMNQLSGVGLSNVNSTLQAANQNMSQLITTIQSIFPRTFGTFTMTAAATTTVTQTAIQSTSYVVLIPTNSAAATLIGSAKSPYISAKTVGSSFVVSTANGVAAAGTEQFAYFLLTPV